MAYVTPIRSKGTGKTVYRAQLQVAKQRFSATFERKTDIRDWEAEIRRTFTLNRSTFTNFNNRRTLTDAINRYREAVLSQPERAKTLRDRHHHLLWWENEIGAVRLIEITTSLISECKERLANSSTKHCKRRSPATVNRYLSSLSHLLSIAKKEWQWIPSNPAADVSKFREPVSRIRYLRNEEIERLRCACRKSRNRNLELIFLIAIATAMRRGEILSLRYEDINLSTRTISVKKTKNGLSRAVPISDPLYPHLEKVKKDNKDSTSLLFPSPNNAQRPVSIKQAWSSALASAGIENYRFHDNRHTAASYLAMSGASLIQIAEVLGHKTLAMVQRYAHLSAQANLDAVNKMDLRIDR